MASIEGKLQIKDTLQMAIGATIDEFSIDGNLAGNSDTAVPTEKAVKTYVDAASTAPGGATTQIQFNDAGSFGGDSALVWNKTNDALLLSSAVAATRLEIDNDGTGHGVDIHQDGVLAASKHGLYVYSNAAHVNGDSALVKIVQDNASATQPTLEINNDGTGVGINLSQNNSLGAALYIASASTSWAIRANITGNVSGTSAFLFDSGVAQGGTAGFMRINLGHASSTNHVLKLQNAGSGKYIETDAGAGTPAHLTNSGVWTNASSCYADKTEINELEITGFIDKIKALKLFSYKKRTEVDKGMPYQRTYKGYILDDPETPDELIARDLFTGNISGVSDSDGVNFLLAVCKEVINRVETLENN